ncbi:MAG: signal peptidase I [Acidobacteriota bacterium]|nr:signal peptidase I [Acidobacteriota bacterium]
MSIRAQFAACVAGIRRIQRHMPTVPEALASLLGTIVVALFVNTFLLQPFLIPSESMEHTLLVGDFLLVNKQVYAPAGSPSNPVRWLLPYRDVERGDVVVFHYPEDPKELLVKRVVGIPGDHLRIVNGHATVNGHELNEPYLSFEPAIPSPFRDNFPAAVYTDPNIDPAWWRVLRSDTYDGELVVPPGKFFVLGDNRNHSKDSRFWGFVSRQAIASRPLVIYFSVRRPSTTDKEVPTNDRLGHESQFSARLASFARWNRIFQVVH